MSKKGKRELFLEIDGDQVAYQEFKKMLDDKVKEAGIKYGENVKMYFNLNEKAIYCVSESGQQLKISF